ncbi:hypothetical protein [Nitrosovibrio sp. Nv4]|uniref:hypothetical protein n=1 Tax=Nitrosovibrio sp. Nv4 TaxID=1945880 RepID=UPI000BC60684|nr:hypothetical protein [Nitrosovibrio sp. Nv4]SOD41973.1 hypothetical protein SAMN06298226_2297 [Nitrosovibrio sp. Nv4]
MEIKILAVFLLSSSLMGSVLAQTSVSIGPKPDPQVAQLEMALNRLNQEQQSVYQQFQMIQDLRRNEIQDGHPLIVQGPPAMGGVKDAPPTNYDDNIRLQRERQERIQKYTDDLNRLYSRYAELGEQKKTLLDQIMELSKAPGR